jgi:hypothetical protein
MNCVIKYTRSFRKHLREFHKVDFILIVLVNTIKITKIMSTTKKKCRTIKAIMKFFDNDIMTPDFLLNNLKVTEFYAFWDALSKHPTRYLRGRSQFSKKQLEILEWLNITKCKNLHCEEYHKTWKTEFCHHCQLYEKQSAFMKFVLNVDETECCSICIADIEKDSLCAKLQCGHSFHVKCIQTWFKSSIKCPCCRRNFES